MLRITRQFFTSGAMLAIPLVALLTLAAPVGLHADETDEDWAVTYRGHLIDNTGTLPRQSSAPIEMRIEEWTTPTDGESMAVKLEGELDADVEDVEWGDPVGRVSIGITSIGYPIAAAFREVDEDDDRQHITLLIRRPLDFGAIFGGGPGTSYPFTIIELNLDAVGNGSGQLVPAADVDLVNGHTLVIDEYTAVPLWIVHVEKVG